jgi:hypothetical protein
MRGLNLVAIHVNKSNDQLALREQLDIPRIAARTSPDGGQFGVPYCEPVSEAEVLTDGQRIHRMRKALTTRLEGSDDESERKRLIDAYNARVRRMNIRYRRTGLYRDTGRTPASPSVGSGPRRQHRDKADSSI